jgi:hypothetical protein
MTRNRSVIGTTLSLLLAATGFCAFTGAVIAAQSATFMLQETGPGNAAGVTHGSPSFQMQGDVSWRQEAPLHSNTFQITKDPPAPASSSVPTSSAPASSARAGTSGGGGDVPPRSSLPRSSTPRSSAPASSVRPSSAAAVSSASTTSASVSSDHVRPAADVSSFSSSSIAVGTATSGSSSSAAVQSSSSSVTSSSASSSFACDRFDVFTVVCHEPFYRQIVLLPAVPDVRGPSIADAFAEAVATFSEAPAAVSLALLWLLGLMLSVVVGYFNAKASESNSFVRRSWYVLLALFAGITIALFTVQHAFAAVTSPQRHVYNGHLLNASGQAITTPHYIRFSEWYSRDMDPTDVSAGVINTAAPTYAGYQEVHVVTPDSQGYFSVELGSGASLPDLAAMDASDLDNLFLQVEVKAAGNPDTSYELLDVNPSDDAIDRSPLLSVPFAQNADLLDQREIGTGSGDIVLLGSGGVLPVAVMPGGTNSDTFVVDANNTAASEIVLQFGGALAKTLKYDVVNDTFEFSSDVKINGDLVVTGLINGIDISAISGSDAGKLRASSGAGLTISVTGGSYRINGVVTDFTGASNVAVPANAVSQVFIGSGGLTVRTSGFPLDESFIRIAEVTTNGIGVTQIDDGRVILSDDRELPTEVNMHAEFQNASYQGDAVDNVGQLSVQLDNITQRNFYLWTSTRTTLQDYDVVVRVTLPADFVRWDAAPMSVAYRTTSADSANSKLDVSIFDTNGAPVALGGAATGLASTSWGTASLTYDTGATWTAGSEFLVKVKLYAKDNYQAHLGSLKLKYIRLAP